MTFKSKIIFLFLIFKFDGYGGISVWWWFSLQKWQVMNATFLQENAILPLSLLSCRSLIMSMLNNVLNSFNIVFVVPLLYKEPRHVMSLIFNLLLTISRWMFPKKHIKLTWKKHLTISISCEPLQTSLFTVFLINFEKFQGKTKLYTHEIHDNSSNLNTEETWKLYKTSTYNKMWSETGFHTSYINKTLLIHSNLFL